MRAEIEALRQFGLNDKEIKLYLTSLETGPTTVLELSKRSGIKRTNLYNYIDSMVSRGFLSLTISGNKKLYTATRPDELKLFSENEILDGEIKTAIDLGAGNGYLTKYIANHAPNATVYAIDASCSMTDNIENHKNIEILNKKPERTDMENSSVDAIFSLATFHHITNINTF